MNTIIYADNKNENNNRNGNSSKNSRRNIWRIWAVFGLSLLASVCIVFGVQASVPKDFDLNTPSNTVPPGNKIPGMGGETHEIGGGKDIDDPQNGGDPNTLPPGHSGPGNQNPEDIENEYLNYDIVTEYECEHEFTRTEEQNHKYPTCVMPGSYEVVTRCIDCEEQVDCVTMKLEISENAHKAMQTIPYSAPTCETPGNIEYYVCNDCDRWFQPDLVEIYNHNDVLIPAKNHSWGEWTVSRHASCTTDGLMTKTCLHDPDHVETKSIPCGHIPQERRETVPATCTEDGGEYAVVFCTVCSDELSRTLAATLPKTGHTPGTPVEENRVEAVFIHEGSCEEVVYCSVCKAELSRTKKTIPAPEKLYEENMQNHQQQSQPDQAAGWTDWEVKKIPTCEEDGIKVRYYNNMPEEQPIPMLGHAWGEWELVTEATIWNEGVMRRVCAHDGSHIEIYFIDRLSMDGYQDQLVPNNHNRNGDAGNILDLSPGEDTGSLRQYSSVMTGDQAHTIIFSIGGDNAVIISYNLGSDFVKVQNLGHADGEEGTWNGSALWEYHLSPFIRDFFAHIKNDRLNRALMIEIADMTDGIKSESRRHFRNTIKDDGSMSQELYMEQLKMAEDNALLSSYQLEVSLGAENAGRSYNVYLIDPEQSAVFPAGTVVASEQGSVTIKSRNYSGLQLLFMPVE